MPETVAVNAILTQGEQAVVAVPHVEVYPNGLVVNVAITTNPHEPMDLHQLRRQYGPFPVRLGVRFADGREAGRRRMEGPLAASRGPEGLPTAPVIFSRGGGGGSNGWRYGFWVYPLPPEGPLEVIVGLPGGEELHVVLDGAAIQAAAERARVVWT